MLLLQSLVYSYSIDCGPLADLAASFGFGTTAVSNLRNGNCCSSSNINCDTNSRVTYVGWTSQSLTGTFNQAAFVSLTYLTKMEIYYNSLTGPLPTQFPPNFQYLDIDTNGFTGPVPVFPSTMLTFWGSRNSLSGNLPTFPNSMVKLYLDGGNVGISGAVALNAPTQLMLKGCSTITGISITNKGGLTTSNCDITGTGIYKEDAAFLSGNCLISGLASRPTTTTSKPQLTTTNIFKFLGGGTTTLSSFVPVGVSVTNQLSLMTTGVIVQNQLTPTTISKISPTTIPTVKTTTTPLTTKPAVKTTTTPNLYLNTRPAPRDESLFSYMESSTEYFEPMTQGIATNNNGLYGVTLEKLITNPIFYGCIFLVILFIFAMAFAREVQRKKRVDANFKKQQKNNGNLTELSFNH